MCGLFQMNFRYMHSYKSFSGSIAYYHLLSFKSSCIKSISKRRYPVLHTLNRNLSWNGFYASISASTPVSSLQNFLIDFHQSSCLPWWAVIMLTTLGLRTFIIFPLAVHQNQVITRLTNLNAELAKLAPELNKEVNIASKLYGWDDTTAKKIFKRNIHQYYQKFVLRDNCHPFKTILLAFLQIPVWICFSVSLRNLTFLPPTISAGTKELHSQLKIEGVLWFTDLTIPDFYGIPLLLAIINLSLIEVHALRQFGKSSPLQKFLLYGMRLTVIIVAGAAAINPTCVSFYWLCSSSFGLGQSLLLMFPKVRRALRIPATANESITPVKDIVHNFKKRFMT